MNFWPVPDVMKDNIYQITPRMFLNRGIRFIMLDVDNTIAPYSVHGVSPSLKEWVEEMKKAGLELFILSNNKGERPEVFAKALEIEYRKKALKPFTKTAIQVMRQKGYSPSQTAFIGDQIYTDTCCGKWMGAFTVLVRPIEFPNFFLKLRYWLEFPFRLKYKWRFMK